MRGAMRAFAAGRGDGASDDGATRPRRPRRDGGAGGASRAPGRAVSRAPAAARGPPGRAPPPATAPDRRDPRRARDHAA